MVKKALTLIGILLICCSFNPGVQKVYVCNSSTSVAYHQDRDCRGLGRCRHEIIYVTQEEAVNTYGKRACKICY